MDKASLLNHHDPRVQNLLFSFVSMLQIWDLQKPKIKRTPTRAKVTWRRESAGSNPTFHPECEKDLRKDENSVCSRPTITEPNGAYLDAPSHQRSRSPERTLVPLLRRPYSSTESLGYFLISIAGRAEHLRCGVRRLQPPLSKSLEHFGVGVLGGCQRRGWIPPPFMLGKNI
jgi:hypothetical protein